MHKLITGLSTLLLLSISFNCQAANATMISVYTSLLGKNCKTLELIEDEGGSYKGLCKGINGYQLLIMEGDLRQSITVIAPNKQEYPLDFWTRVSSSFSHLGDNAEWRVRKQGNHSTPEALIVRFNASEGSDAEKETSYLVIMKIAAHEVCITDIVKPQAKANETARKLADKAQQAPCKFK